MAYMAKWLIVPSGSCRQVAHVAKWFMWPNGSCGQVTEWLRWPSGSDGFGHGVGEGGCLELFSLGHLCPLLELVVVDDVLVGRAALYEGIQLVHFRVVLPQGGQVT